MSSEEMPPPPPHKKRSKSRFRILDKVEFTKPVRYYPSAAGYAKLMALKREYGKTSSEIIDSLLEKRDIKMTVVTVTLPEAVYLAAEEMALRLGYSSASSWIQESLQQSIPHALRSLIEEEGEYTAPWQGPAKGGDRK